jgi:hypothetical protein
MGEWRCYLATITQMFSVRGGRVHGRARALKKDAVSKQFRVFRNVELFNIYKLLGVARTLK